MLKRGDQYRWTWRGNSDGMVVTVLGISEDGQAVCVEDQHTHEVHVVAVLKLRTEATWVGHATLLDSSVRIRASVRPGLATNFFGGR